MARENFGKDQNSEGDLKISHLLDVKHPIG